MNVLGKRAGGTEMTGPRVKDSKVRKLFMRLVLLQLITALGALVNELYSKGGGLRLKLRLKPNGILFGWDIARKALSVMFPSSAWLVAIFSKHAIDATDRKLPTALPR